MFLLTHLEKIIELIAFYTNQS